jgi:beta-glucosidase
MKHFIGNEQETNRVPRDDVAAVSSNIDDKTMHELYLWYVITHLQAY